MHRELMDRCDLAGIERGLGGKPFVAELHDRGLPREVAADEVSQIFGVTRGAARLYLRSHPAWASAAPRTGDQVG